MGNETLNCWEVMKCGREENGAKAAELGVCPAASDKEADGLNRGRNGGRICWSIAGTLCGGTRQGANVQKESTCLTCAFYSWVQAEEPASGFRFRKPKSGQGAG